MNRLAEVIATLALAVPTVASAQSSPGVVDFSDTRDSLTAGIGFPFTTGWTFAPTAAVSVTDLGLYDIGGDGFVASHQIGLWNASGALVTSGTIASGTPSALRNGWRYVDVSDVMLTVGETYTLGAAYAFGTDAYPYDPTSLTVDPRISFGQGISSGTFTGFTRPTLAEPYAILGPNLLLTSAVPEPATWAMMIGGLMIAGLSLRRSRAQPTLASARHG